MNLVAATLSLIDATKVVVSEKKAIAAANNLLRTATFRISRRIAVRTATSATRSAATLAGKVVPYLGAASVLALTAYDIADACQTLRDASELAHLAGEPPAAEESIICGLRVPSVQDVFEWSGGLWR